MGGTITEKELRELEERVKTQPVKDGLLEKMRELNALFTTADRELRWRDGLSKEERELLEIRVQSVVARHVERREFAKRLLEARVAAGVGGLLLDSLASEALALADTLLEQAYADQSSAVQAIESEHKTCSWLRGPR